MEYIMTNTTRNFSELVFREGSRKSLITTVIQSPSSQPNNVWGCFFSFNDGRIFRIDDGVIYAHVKKESQPMATFSLNNYNFTQGISNPNKNGILFQLWPDSNQSEPYKVTFQAVRFSVWNDGSY